MKTKITLFLLLFINLYFLKAQDVKIVNGGFEDRPHFGRTDIYDPIDGWFDCGRIEFPIAIRRFGRIHKALPRAELI
jgi:hypothetical protein